MDVNLIVIKARFIIKRGALDLSSFCQKYKTNPGVRRRAGRVDFYTLGNVVSITARGFVTIYISVDKTFVVDHIEEILLAIGEIFLPFTTRKESFSIITYKAVNLQLSGKFALDRISLLKTLKKHLEKQEDLEEIIVGSGQTIARFTQPSSFPNPPFAYTYIQIKLSKGKITILHTGSFTIITYKFNLLEFWENFVSAILRDGDPPASGI